MEPVRMFFRERYEDNPQQMAQDGVAAYASATGAALRWGARRAGFNSAHMPARSFSPLIRQVGYGLFTAAGRRAMLNPVGMATMLAGGLTAGTMYGINRMISPSNQRPH